jgi:hypothetical protein
MGKGEIVYLFCMTRVVSAGLGALDKSKHTTNTRRKQAINTTA